MMSDPKLLEEAVANSSHKEQLVGLSAKPGKQEELPAGLDIASERIRRQWKVCVCGDYA